MRALIDTCVVIDVLQKREPFWSDAADVLRAAANDEFEGYITAKSVTDIFYLTHRFAHDNDAARTTVEKLARIFVLADTMGDDCLLALSRDMSDYEDAVMDATALRIGADAIVTRNLEDYRKSSVPAVSPQAFLERLHGSRGGAPVAVAQP